MIRSFLDQVCSDRIVVGTVIQLTADKLYGVQLIERVDGDGSAEVIALGKPEA